MNSKMDWANLDSRNERVVDATWQDRLAPVSIAVTAAISAAAARPATDPAPKHAAGSPPSPSRPAEDCEADQAGPAELSAPGLVRGRGRHRRASRAAAAAAVTAAAAAALAIPASASAAHTQPAVPLSWKIVKSTHAKHGPNFSAVTASSPSNAWAFETFQTSSAKRVAWHLSGSAWSTASFPGQAGEQVTAAGSARAGDVWAITSTGTTTGTAGHGQPRVAA